ncbi:MAG: 3-hydroxyacyl-CoA dehydrogenase NAD-binding domain-containing protein [Thermoplasmata archaeon]
MQKEKIVVFGAGTMGHGIATVFAANDFSVFLLDVDQKYLDNARIKIKKNLEKMSSKGAVIGSVDEALNRIMYTTDLNVAKDADLVVEAIIENIEEKKKLFKKLNEIANRQAILASNTSSISITQLGSFTDRPENVVGMHFFNPVPVLKLVEIVRGLGTSDDTIMKVTDFAKKVGKVPVLVSDYPGFVANRILMPFINEGIYTLQENIATKESIDSIAKLGFNMPMGPLELADLIGLDVCLDIMNVLYRDFGNQKYSPCPLLKKMVAAGKLGRKSGEGFYKY